jgi:hypothetical protein
LESLEERAVLSANNAWDIVIEPISGTQYLTVLDPTGGNDSDGAIIRFNPVSGGTQLVSDNAISRTKVFVDPTGITTESIGGTQYLTVVDPNGGNDGLGAVVRVNPVNSSVQLVSDDAIAGYKAFNHPTAVTTEVVGGTQYLAVLDPTGGNDGHGAVLQVNPVNGVTQLVSDNAINHGTIFVDPTGITTQSIGGAPYLTVVDPNGGNDGLGAVLQVNPVNGGVQMVSDDAIAGYKAFNHPTAIAAGPAGGTPYLAVLDPTGGSAATGAVICINPANGGTQLSAAGGYLNQPTGVAVSAQGNIVVIDPNSFGGEGAVLQLDSQSGNNGAGTSAIAQNGIQAQILIALADGQASAPSFYSNGNPSNYLNRQGDLFSRSASGLSLVDTDVLFYCVTNGGATLNMWETPPPGASPQALTATSFIGQQDIDLIRQQPTQFPAVYQKYAARFKALFGSGFQGLTNEGSIAAFACLVAYQLAPYRSRSFSRSCRRYTAPVVGRSSPGLQ